MCWIQFNSDYAFSKGRKLQIKPWRVTGNLFLGISPPLTNDFFLFFVVNFHINFANAWIKISPYVCMNNSRSSKKKNHMQVSMKYSRFFVHNSKKKINLVCLNKFFYYFSIPSFVSDLTCAAVCKIAVNVVT